MIVVSRMNFIYHCAGIHIYPGSNVVDDSVKERLTKNAHFIEKTKTLGTDGAGANLPLLEIAEATTPLIDEAAKAAVKAGNVEVGNSQVLMQANSILGMSETHALKALKGMMHVEVLHHVADNATNAKVRSLAEKRLKEITTLTPEEQERLNAKNR